MKQNIAKEVRENAYTAIEDLKFGDFEFYGRVQEGAVMNDGNSNYMILKCIIKKDAFADEVDELVAEFIDKETKKAEKKAGKAKEVATTPLSEAAEAIVAELL